MAEIVDVPIKHVKCDCGELIEIETGRVFADCYNCYRRFGLSYSEDETKIEKQGFFCLNCEQLTPKLFGTDKVCVNCISHKLKEIEAQILFHTEGLKLARTKLDELKAQSEYVSEQLK